MKECRGREECVGRKDGEGGRERERYNKSAEKIKCGGREASRERRTHEGMAEQLS